MVAAQIKIVVVGHHSRRDMATRLADSLDAHMLIDEENNGANWNHRRAIEWAGMQPCRVVIIEDDAIPVRRFIEKALQWLDRFPEELVSFYLGTGRPPHWQPVIRERLDGGADHITLPMLIHGVCYSIPPQNISRILDKWDRHLAADYAVGQAWGGGVIYTSSSLVDHADGISVEQHPDGIKRTESRKAWKLET